MEVSHPYSDNQNDVKYTEIRKTTNIIVNSRRGVRTYLGGGGRGRVVSTPRASGFKVSKIKILSEKNHFMHSIMLNY